jgi:hypothetical protein
MEIKHILTIGLLATCHIALSSQIATAKSSDEVLLYQFQQNKGDNIEQSQEMMRKFLPEEPAAKLEAKDGSIARYVSKKDVNTTFEYDYNTGNMRFKRDFSRYLGDFVPKLPSTDESVEIAHKFLEENGLQPQDESQLKLAHVGGLRSSSLLDGKRSGPVVDKLVTLTYSREINGIPVIGPGSKFIVHIGDRGKIIGIKKHWRELQKKAIPLSAKQLLNEDEAFFQAKESIATEFGKDADFELLHHQLAYYDNNGQYLQPVYTFQVKIHPANSSIDAFNYVSVIEAMKNPKEALNLRTIEKAALLELEKAKPLNIINTEEKLD